MENLNRYNAISNNVYALDNALRFLGYSCALFNLFGGRDNLTEFRDFLDILSGKIGEARTMNRFCYGLPASIAGVFAYGNDQSLESILGRIMALSMVLYHPLEHGWFLSTMKPSVFNIDGGKWSLWSCRMWLVYVICDLVLNVRGLKNVADEMESKKPATSESREKLRKLETSYLLALSGIAADSVLALQYSKAKGPFGPRILALAGWYGGLIGLYRRWRNASPSS